MFFVLPLLALVHGDSWSARLLTADDVARSVMLVFFMECGRAVSPFVTEAFFAQHGECPHKTPNMLTGPTPKESRGLGRFEPADARGNSLRGTIDPKES